LTAIGPTIKMTEKSVSGALDFVGECLAAWWSQGQATNALSSTEAEYTTV
jgi:hypothetical protein